ncbi:hypothetical protein MM710_35810, partial [Klebsiella pneumoniae]|nr:hypothetical protein [Klebsiella pneumoniae]
MSADKKYFETRVNPTSVFWTGGKWKERLVQIMSQTQEQDILKFLKHTASPAMHELQRELSEEYGLSVRVDKMFHQDEPAIEFVIRKETMRDFMYGIKSVGQDVSDQLINDGNL